MNKHLNVFGITDAEGERRLAEFDERPVHPMNYRSDWNELMRVVHKILKRYENKKRNGRCELLRYALYWSAIDHVFATAVMCVTDFNKTNNP